MAEHEESAHLFMRCAGVPDDVIDPETPRRMLEAFKSLLEGYHQDPDEHLKKFEHPDHTSGMVILNGEFTSMCEHHVLPFSGTWWIGYIPKKNILGASKFKRIVDVFSKRLQTQERLSKEICSFLTENLDALGVMVVMKAEHSCMRCRGIRARGSMTTSAISGVFMNESPRMEFLHLIKE
jgi:GTP cyclohydrolase I